MTRLTFGGTNNRPTWSPDGRYVVIPARPADTAPDAERVQVALLRAAPVARRLHIAMALSATIIGAARRALARAQPQASPRELDLRFVELHYGTALVADLRADLDRRDATPRPGA